MPTWCCKCLPYADSMTKSYNKNGYSLISGAQFPLKNFNLMCTFERIGNKPYVFKGRMYLQMVDMKLVYVRRLEEELQSWDIFGWERSRSFGSRRRRHDLPFQLSPERRKRGHKTRENWIDFQDLPRKSILAEGKGGERGIGRLRRW